MLFPIWPWLWSSCLNIFETLIPISWIVALWRRWNFSKCKEFVRFVRVDNFTPKQSAVNKQGFLNIYYFKILYYKMYWKLRKICWFLFRQYLPIGQILKTYVNSTPASMETSCTPVTRTPVPALRWDICTLKTIFHWEEASTKYCTLLISLISIFYS